MREGNGLGPGDVLFYLHIPKTGGVSLYDVIDVNFSPEEVFPVPEPLRSRRMFQELSPAAIAHIRCVRGHFWFGPGDWGAHDFLKPDPVTITFLRDPVSRTVSVYQFVLAHPELWLAKKIVRPEVPMHELDDQELDDEEVEALRSMSIAEFVRHPQVWGEVANLQARLVVGRTAGGFLRGDDPSRVQRLSDDDLLAAATARLETFAFVGLTERFQESVALLANRLGWDLPESTPRLNAADRASESIELTPPDREAILEQVEVDIALYDHGRRVFEAESAARQLA
jgi:hypothetical protein